MHKAVFCPPLTNVRKEKRLQWAQKYKKTNFQTVLFTDECHATLDAVLDGWQMATMYQQGCDVSKEVAK